MAESATALRVRPFSRVAGVALRGHVVRPGEGGRWPNPQGSAPFLQSGRRGTSRARRGHSWHFVSISAYCCFQWRTTNHAPLLRAGVGSFVSIFCGFGQGFKVAAGLQELHVNVCRRQGFSAFAFSLCEARTGEEVPSGHGCVQGVGAEPGPSQQAVEDLGCFAGRRQSTRHSHREQLTQPTSFDVAVPCRFELRLQCPMALVCYASCSWRFPCLQTPILPPSVF